MNSPEISAFGQNAINISWEKKIDPELHNFILDYEVYLQSTYTYFQFESVVTYHSLVLYLNDKSKQAALLKILEEINLDNITSITRQSRTWKIPTCYDSKLGFDLKFVADHNNCSVDEVVQLHSQRRYRVYFMGFLPGFLYLGGLDKKIHCPRKPNPRLSVLAGSIGIADSQTGIYPQNSPGGWQIIGRTPIPLFNAKTDPPSAFKSGDYIQFTPIEMTEFNQLSELIKAGGELILKSTLDD